MHRRGQGTDIADRVSQIAFGGNRDDREQSEVVDHPAPSRVIVVGRLLEHDDRNADGRADLEAQVDRLGGRVYVQMDHGYQPIGAQLYREVRQLFLSRFDV